MESKAKRNRVLDRLPHAPPMRLIEEILSVSPGKSARARRFAAPSDWYFQGHFPRKPIVPAVALVELLAQTGGIAAYREADRDRSFRVAAFGPFKFPEPASPGVWLVAQATVERRMGPLVKVAGTVTVEGRTVADGSITLAAVAERRA